MKELINIHGEMSEAQAEAVKLHQNIMLNAELAANSMIAMCRDLKIMRDRRLYEELGCAEFSEYTENLVGIKARQAYTYISTYEKLGDTVLQSNATLGITKLSLIAQMNAEDRAEMLESGQADDMTVAELKKLVEENKNQGEQISILNAEIEELKKKESEGADGSELESEIEDLKKQLDEKHALVEKLENDLEESKKAEVPDTKALEEKIESKILKKAEAEKKKAFSAGEKSAENAAKEKINALNSQIEAAQSRAQELEKQLALSDSASAEAKVYISSIQAEFNALMGVISSMPTEQAEKFKGAVKKLCGAIVSRCD
nr:MAG TPA: Protein of unknown function (DUF3102) [Caudoviricetes sp.]